MVQERAPRVDLAGRMRLHEWSGVPVDLRRAKTADGVGEKNGVGFAEVIEREAALRGGGVCLENKLAVHSGDEAAFDGRGDEAAGAFDKDVVVGALSDLASVIDEEDFVVAGQRCLCQGFDVERPVGGLVERHGIERVDAMGRQGDAERLWVGGFFGQDFARELECAIGRKEQAHFARAAIGKGRPFGVQGGTNLPALTGKSEVIGGICEAAEM